MKKTMLMVATVAMLITGLAGCAGCSGNEAVNPTVVPTATEAPTEAVAPSDAPTEEPVVDPTTEPTAAPAEAPTMAVDPTEEPVATEAPTSTPVPTATATPEPTATSTSTPSQTVTPTSTPTPVPTNTPTPKPTSIPSPSPTPTPVKGIEVGDYVTFGSYEQDNDLSNGKEPIEWLVLDTEDGKAFLLAKYCLDAQKYDANFSRREFTQAILNGTPEAYDYDVTWEKSTLRAWLNNEFYNAAFTTGEQKSILLTDVENLPNANRGTSSGPDTKDYVYLLSEREALEYFGKEWILKYFDVYGDGPEKREHLGNPTEYTLAQGATVKGSGRWYGGYCAWWLRTIGGDSSVATHIGESGFLDQDGGFADATCNGIRPVVWIDVTTADVEKGN